MLPLMFVRMFPLLFLGALLSLFSASHANADDLGSSAQASPIAPAGSQPAETFLHFSQDHLLLGLTEFSLYNLYLGAPDIRGSAYIPNFSPKLGFDLTWKGFGIAASFPLPLPESEIERRGPSQQTSLILSRYWRSFGFDLYYQSYKGLYAHSPLADLGPDRPARFPQLPDAFALNAGLNGYYAFDPNHYSLAAAFTQSEFQAVGGGSWLLTPFYNHLQLSMGDVFKPGSDPSSSQTPPPIASGSFDAIGSGFGYGYNWVSGRFFLSAQSALGLGIQYQRLARANQEPMEALSLAFKGNLNFAAGVNGQTYLGGIRGLVHSISSRVRDVQVASTLVAAQLFFGGRF